MEIHWERDDQISVGPGQIISIKKDVGQKGEIFYIWIRGSGPSQDFGARLRVKITLDGQPAIEDSLERICGGFAQNAGKPWLETIANEYDMMNKSYGGLIAIRLPFDSKFEIEITDTMLKSGENGALWYRVAYKTR